MEIHLLARIILVNVDPIPHHLIHRILYAVETTGRWMFRHANGVAQAPAYSKAIGIIIVRIICEVVQIECPDLTVT
jgi:hypothetical protein